MSYSRNKSYPGPIKRTSLTAMQHAQSDDSKYVIEEDTSYSILRELESSHENSNFTHGSVLSNSNELISKEQRPHVMHDTLPTTSPDVPQASRRG